MGRMNLKTHAFCGKKQKLTNFIKSPILVHVTDEMVFDVVGLHGLASLCCFGMCRSQLGVVFEQIGP